MGNVHLTKLGEKMCKYLMLSCFSLVLGLTFSQCPKAQQVADTTFIPKTGPPAFEQGKGPIVYIDEAHNNFHTADGRFKVFARLLRLDGFVVKSSKAQFTKNTLQGCDILVISNAISDKNVNNWDLPNYPAFTSEEVKVVKEWVNDGGALLLIADHIPFPAAADELAAAFGVDFNNGYVFLEEPRGIIVFRRRENLLLDHPITNGRNLSEKIDSVATFTGQAFKGDSLLVPILKFGKGAVSFMPEKSRDFTSDIKKIDVSGWFQGAVIKFGKGRAAFFGEAASFTAQISKYGNPMGMNDPVARQNAQFVLNILHWLAELLD